MIASTSSSPARRALKLSLQIPGLVNVYRHLWKITICVNQLFLFWPFSSSQNVELPEGTWCWIYCAPDDWCGFRSSVHRIKIFPIGTRLVNSRRASECGFPRCIFTCIPPLYSNNDNNNNHNNNIILYIINYIYIYDMIHLSYIIIYIYYTYQPLHPFCICYLTLWSTGAASPTAAVLARRSSWWPRWHLLLRGPMGFGIENLGIPIVNNIIVMGIPKYYYI